MDFPADFPMGIWIWPASVLGSMRILQVTDFSEGRARRSDVRISATAWSGITGCHSFHRMTSEVDPDRCRKTMKNLDLDRCRERIVQKNVWLNNTEQVKDGPAIISAANVILLIEKKPSGNQTWQWNRPFIDDFPIKSPFFQGISPAMGNHLASQCRPPAYPIRPLPCRPSHWRTLGNPCWPWATEIWASSNAQAGNTLFLGWIPFQTIIYIHL